AWDAQQPCKGNPALAHISLARALQQETKLELQKMEEQQEMRSAMLEELVTATVKRVNEQVRSWGSTPTTPDLGLEEQEEGTGDCCTFNIRECVVKLLKHCENLQEQVESLESQQVAMAKCNKLMRKYYTAFPSKELEHDQERLHYVEATVVQMKGDCEKLSFVSGNLQKDSEQKHKEI
ncbi:QRIC2 protein, partial [Pheucticus melanocephalus]|nr:QRIC2 protein [Pheucticus melanocephalus]